MPARQTKAERHSEWVHIRGQQFHKTATLPLEQVDDVPVIPRQSRVGSRIERCLVHEPSSALVGVRNFTTHESFRHIDERLRMRAAGVR